MDGPGTDTVAVGDVDGYVVLSFQNPVLFVKLDPPTAKAAAEHILARCYKATWGDFPSADKKNQAAEQMRIKLRNRITLMLRSAEREAPRPTPEILAQRVVDKCLAEAI